MLTSLNHVKGFSTRTRNCLAWVAALRNNLSSVVRKRYILGAFSKAGDWTVVSSVVILKLPYPFSTA